MSISYRLKNISSSVAEALFGSEWNINLLGGGRNEQAYYRIPGLSLDDHHLDSQGELNGVNKVVLGNRQVAVELELTIEPRVKLWRFPVESVSNSEGGIEKLYQASCLVVLLPLKLSPGDVARLDLTWRVRPPAT
ncbi:MAG TPA: DUF1926 domain-containing protein [Dehalococcoidia bacterium]|nr:DUF1926 domain-containing protein [Dehalococcoidia bacterium]